MSTQGRTIAGMTNATGIRFTERLRLEPIASRHADDLWRIHQDDRVAEWYPLSHEQAVEMAETMERQWAGGAVFQCRPAPDLFPAWQPQPAMRLDLGEPRHSDSRLRPSPPMAGAAPASSAAVAAGSGGGFRCGRPSRRLSLSDRLESGGWMSNAPALWHAPWRATMPAPLGWGGSGWQVMVMQ